MPPQSADGRSSKGGKGNGRHEESSKGAGKADSGGYSRGKGDNSWKGSGRTGYNRASSEVYAPAAAAVPAPAALSHGGGAAGRAPGRGGRDSRPPALEEDAIDASQSGTHLWPITPLGLPRTPPPLPPVFNMPFFEEFPSAALPVPGRAPLGPAALARQAAQEREQARVAAEESWMPVAERGAVQDRRMFFHSEGRPLAYNPAGPTFRKPVNADERLPLGVSILLKVEEVHFGNPRVRAMQGEPAPMPQMLKWPATKYDEHLLDCAEIDFGDYRVWSAIGIRSNRLLYAMKRLMVKNLQAVVVAPPVPEAEDDVDLTYGASIQAIQVVP